MRGFPALLEAELQALSAIDRRRECPEAAGSSRLSIEVAGKPMLSFCSNDYLGLASHPALLAAATEAAVRDGFGASASRLVAGDLPAHRELEGALAAFLDRPSSLVFPSGYQTNVGVLTALAGRDDLIVSDALNHASLVDGCRLSRARVEIYPHGDAAAARRLLDAAGPARRRLLVTESLFSMDGDIAPLAALAETAAATDSILVVDEAHAFGALGPGGRGLCAAAGVDPDVMIATLGKAVGAAGGFVAGPRELRDLLVNRARTFVFTTALPPPVAAAATAAIRLIAGPEGDRLRSRLAEHIASMTVDLGRRGLVTSRAPGPIVPIVLGAETRALQVAASLRQRGFFVPAIRPPTVPAGSSRLRVTLSAAHEPADIQGLAAALTECLA
ncbi:MAG TPA: 8-amino-7-oxononanoate synthase [Polyangia bacterium]|jgi:8-amino-7-oxononanoate synthase